jgi:hypothetical protein
VPFTTLEGTTLTIDDPWAVEPSGQGRLDPAQILGPQDPGPQPPAEPFGPDEPAGPSPVLCLVVAALFAVAGVVLLGQMFMHVQDSSPLYEYPNFYPGAALGLVLLVVAALILNPETRRLAGGLGMGTAPIYIAYQSVAFRPSVLTDPDSPLFRWSYAGALAEMLIGVLLLLIAHLSARSRADRTRPGQGRPAVVAVVGILGVGLWLVGKIVDQFEVIYTTPGIPALYEPVTRCCSWTQDDSWLKAGLIAALAMVLPLVLAGAFARRADLGAGLLLGAGLALFTTMILTAFEIILPIQSVSFPRPQDWGLSDELYLTSQAGFWLEGAGAAAVLLAGLLRLKLRRRAQPYLEASIPAHLPSPAPAPEQPS